MLELRPARLEDPDAVDLIADVQRFYVELYGAPDDDPLTPAEFAPPVGGFLLGYLDQRAVAMGGWTRVDDDAGGGGSTAKVRRMYVAPQARRHGYATVLLAALESDAAAAGIAQMILTTGRPQVAAIAFYRAHGYVDIPAYGFYGDQAGAVFLGKPIMIT